MISFIMIGMGLIFASEPWEIHGHASGEIQGIEAFLTDMSNSVKDDITDTLNIVDTNINSDLNTFESGTTDLLNDFQSDLDAKLAEIPTKEEVNAINSRLDELEANMPTQICYCSLDIGEDMIILLMLPNLQ